MPGTQGPRGLAVAAAPLPLLPVSLSLADSTVFFTPEEMEEDRPSASQKPEALLQPLEGLFQGWLSWMA